MSSKEPETKSTLAASPAGSISDGRVRAIDIEDERLQDLGYEQHMKRGFNIWSMTAFCLTGLGLLPSLGGVFPSSPLLLALCLLRKANPEAHHGKKKEPYGTAWAT